MKSKYKVTVVAVCTAFLAISSHSWAQGSDAKTKEYRAEQIEEMQEELDLTSAQTMQVQAILEQSTPQIKADEEKMNSSPNDQSDAIRSQMEKSRVANQEKILAVLTPGQRTNAEKYFKEKSKEEQEEQQEENEKDEQDEKD